MEQIARTLPAADFRLSVTRALRDQLIEALDAIEPQPLYRDLLSELESRGGVYQLYEDGELVYIGKSNQDLPGRLYQHYVKLSGRVGDLLERVAFKCVYVDEDLHAVSAETLLISAYRAQDKAAWNNNGFGNKDPGRQRDTSRVKEEHFDALHPIDLDKSIWVQLPDPPLTANDLMWAVKNALPYNFRFDQSVSAKRSLQALAAPAPDVRLLEEGTAGGWLGWLAEILPDGWTVVALPGYVIAYPGRAAESFPSRIGSWSRERGIATFTAHAADFVAGPVEPEVASADNEFLD